MLRAMRVPLLDLTRQYQLLAEPLRAEIEQVLASQHFVLGPKLDAFEQAIASYLGVPHAIGVSSGTDALLAALMALEIGPGDAVITTAYSFFATAGSIARVGATPIFVDVDPATFNISTCALRNVLEKPHPARVRAIVPVHLFGLCCEMDEIMAIAREHELLVVEDAAQALGADHPTAGKAGTIGTAGCFSFYPSKNLGAAGDAGLIVCRDHQLAHRLRICRNHGMEPRYEHHFIGGNFRLDEIQAAILAVKLPHLDAWNAARRAAGDVYREDFTKTGLARRITLPAEPYREHGPANHHVYHQFVIRTADRDALREHLAGREIETAIYYPLTLHEQKCFQYLGYKHGDFPAAERAARESLALPMYPEISGDMQRFVVNSIAEFFD